MDLFEFSEKENAKIASPLAERMRPKDMDHFFGQSSVVGEGSLLRHAVENDRVFSMILWGPPGCGKTTLAGIMANETQSHFIHFSAVLSGVKQIREVIQEARKQKQFNAKRTILFVDEIHRFNKSQQDAFLHHVESGLITLVGATTENPSFEVISPLLSRCRVITLDMLTEKELGSIIDNALMDEKDGLGRLNLTLEPEAFKHLISVSSGDARCALNNLEIAVSMSISSDSPPAEGEKRRIKLVHVEKALQKKALSYDKGGEQHFNLISAFHKSMRGSDPDAALYWLARMLDAGEDPLYTARRMVRFASEDVGNADPYALKVALGAMESYRFLGKPEGELALAQAAVYLATAPKSNSIYKAWGQVKKIVKEKGSLPVPLHIRNAPTGLMKGLGYGKGYQYAHDQKDAYIPQTYLPPEIENLLFYTPAKRGYEKMIKQRLEKWRQLKKNAGLKK